MTTEPLLPETVHWEKQSDKAGVTRFRLPPDSAHLSLLHHVNPQTHGCTQQSRNKTWPLEGFSSQSLPNPSSPQPAGRTGSSSSFLKGDAGPRTNRMRCPFPSFYFPLSCSLTATESQGFGSRLGHSTGCANWLVAIAHTWWWRPWTKTLTYKSEQKLLISEWSCSSSRR